ncbi:MAG: hypothetical protein IPO07_08660 [Haliscomenobacter sp.]|nr:hypothetical protein [Haliscomenobacter sp.]MBK9488850.1 hypothetical protein [Haliscomenobacter sp.]
MIPSFNQNQLTITLFQSYYKVILKSKQQNRPRNTSTNHIIQLITRHFIRQLKATRSLTFIITPERTLITGSRLSRQCRRFTSKTQNNFTLSSNKLQSHFKPKSEQLQTQPSSKLQPLTPFQTQQPDPCPSIATNSFSTSFQSQNNVTITLIQRPKATIT